MEDFADIREELPGMGTPKAQIPRAVSDVNWEQWRFTEDAVLCFVVDQNKLMLINKKTGLGKGKVNAPGGRIEAGESAIDAAIRETIEETGVEPSKLDQVAELNFIFTDGYSLRGFVFFAYEFKGTPTVTREADPFWCDRCQIPYEKMWADDRLWLPKVLNGERVLGRFIFEGDEMLSHVLLELKL